MIGIQRFCIIGDKNYFDELVKCKHIKQVEINKIVNELNDFMYKYLSNQDLARLSKNLEKIYMNSGQAYLTQKN